MLHSLTENFKCLSTSAKSVTALDTRWVTKKDRKRWFVGAGLEAEETLSLKSMKTIIFLYPGAAVGQRTEIKRKMVLQAASHANVFVAIPLHFNKWFSCQISLLNAQKFPFDIFPYSSQ